LKIKQKYKYLKTIILLMNELKRKILVVSLFLLAVFIQITLLFPFENISSFKLSTSLIVICIMLIPTISVFLKEKCKILILPYIITLLILILFLKDDFSISRILIYMLGFIVISYELLYYYNRCNKLLIFKF
jgi:hypothetical protein